MVYAARLCSQWQAHDGGPVFSPMSGCSAGAGEKGVELMSYYHICPICGAALDPGERCDCQAESKPSTKLEKTEKAAPVLEHRSGRVETGLQTHISTSSLTK